jgi:precorrin-6A synthase
VHPGISSLQALAAAHRVGLNRIGEPIHITTGRQIAAQQGGEIHNSVVMLDAHCTFERFVDQALHIYWGAYVGTVDEVLISGPLHEVSAQIREAREAGRARKGWIMDTYILRREVS